MVKEVIARCDKCRSDENVREFSIIIEGVTKELDLCEKHGKPLVELHALGVVPTRTKGRPASGPRTAHAVVPIEDLDIEDPHS